MKENFDKSFALVLKSEGGFVNNPKDPGGMTNLGVTKKNWEAFVKRTADEKEMRALTADAVKPFYKANYWDAEHCDDLPTGLDYAVFDFAVNAGVGRAAKILQRALGVPEDGHIGPVTMGQIKAASAADLLEKFSNNKKEFYKALPTFADFGKGWLSRVDNVQANAADMIT